MAARSKARKRALDVLYESALLGLDPLRVLAERRAQGQPPVPEYTGRLVGGVVAHRERIDELLATYAVGWTLDRMPPVDLAALRIGVYELLYEDGVPDAVAISEAVALVSSLSTDESARFVNGVLARVLSLKPSLAR